MYSKMIDLFFLIRPEHIIFQMKICILSCLLLTMIQEFMGYHYPHFTYQKIEWTLIL